jgi:ubiquinone biosynthesis protein UbiJ
MILERLEAVLNRNVAESRRATTIARRLDGRVLALTIEGTPFEIFFRADGGRLRLAPRHEGATDARLSGTPASLLALAGPQAEGALRAGGVRIEGDAEVAQKFRELLAEAQPDFEEELARVVGDVAARQVANFARGVLSWGRRASGSLTDSVVEYLQEEGRDLPTRTEVEEFLAEVDHLREDADRLEARLARLESRRSGRAPPAQRRRP